jgi:hypothetical protein
VNQIGINRLVHFDVKKEEIRNEIGRALAPTGPWGAWGKKIEESAPALRCGVVKLVMQESWKEERFFGHYQASVEPSTQISGNSGIFVQVNHHCQKAANDDPGGSDIVNFLESNFEASLRRSEWIIDQLMQLSEELSQ